ncbi:MAG: arsenite methyltransferase [Parasphingorhabdus sp.]|jgi:arsenite methyltransferase
MQISQFMARQYSNPTGWFGKFVTAKLLNRANRVANNAVYNALALTPSDRVLEIGFGGADLLFKIARDSPCNLLQGVEISSTMIDRAQSMMAKDKKLAFTKLSPGSTANLSFCNGSFDCVCSVNTVYFWNDLDKCCFELARVTSKNGRVVLGFGTGEKLHQAGYSEKGFKFHHPDAIQKSMEKAGLDLSNSRRIDRSFKDPFYVLVFSRHD